MKGQDLVSSFYSSSGSSVAGFASALTELEIGVDVTAPASGLSGFNQVIEHTIRHVFLNGVKLQYGVENDFTVNTDTNTLQLNPEWKLYTQDKLLITS